MKSVYLPLFTKLLPNSYQWRSLNTLVRGAPRIYKPNAIKLKTSIIERSYGSENTDYPNGNACNITSDSRVHFRD